VFGVGQENRESIVPKENAVGKYDKFCIFFESCVQILRESGAVSIERALRYRSVKMDGTVLE
jgi:hypothetical protein